MAESSTSTDVKDTNDDNTLTLVDFLEEELQLESDADAVLGPSDDKNCTYNGGYLQRQALYACMTCTPVSDPSSKPAGVCLACSYHCHEDHELIELYTKRFFRCDCGNSRFNGKKCNLESNKTEENEKNVYNQNFRGLYCTCSRPYPDPEDDISDEMLQCIICEDWYHTRHLEGEVPPETNYAELICGICTDRLPFLKYYLGFAVSPGLKNEKASDNEAVNITDVSSGDGTSNGVGVSVDNNIKEDNIGDTKADVVKSLEGGSDISDNKIIVVNSSPNAELNSTKLNGISSSVEVNGSISDECKLKNMKLLERSSQTATFWPSNFRSSLCNCTKCKEMYTSHGVSWIIDENDTVQSYEELAKARKNSSRYEAGMEALASLDRVSQVEAIQSYNDLKSNLSEFLIQFVRQKRVVRKEDIDEFFTDMQAKKKQKVGTPPYTCH